MRIYLHSLSSERAFFSQLRAALERKGHTVCARTPLDFDLKNGHQVINFMEVSNNVELVIVDTRRLAAEEISTMSLALSRHIPVLCIHERGKHMPETVRNIASDLGIRTRFRVTAYDPGKYCEQVCRIASHWPVRRKSEREIIGYAKFTLRLPSSLVGILERHAQDTKHTKAHIVRMIIEREIGKMHYEEKEMP